MTLWKRKRDLALSLALVLGMQSLVQAAAPLPFHSASWFTWMVPNQSFVDLYGQNLDGLSIFAYAFDNSGSNIIQESTPFVDNMLAFYRTQTMGGRRPTFVTIVNDRVSGLPRAAGDVRFDGQMIHDILSDPARRANLVAQIAAQAPKADGIDIDFESLLAATYPYYPLFIRELRQAIGPNKLLVVDAQPKWNSNVGARGNAIDWQAILPYIDQLRVLTYYYSFSGSAPGPVVTQAQLQRQIDYALNDQHVPLNKLHFVFSVFGWDWPQGQLGKIVTYQDAMAIARQRNVTPFRDPASGAIRVNYTDDSGVAHQIWIDDAQSLIPKITSTVTQGIRHVDFWQMGSGDPALWQWIANNTTNFPDPPDDKTPVIFQLSPPSAQPGGPGFTLTILGDNFERGAQVRWNGLARTTTFSSATRLTAVIPASDIAAPGFADVTVFNPINNLLSNAFRFNFMPRPTITTLSPSSARVQGPGFTLVLTGTNFSPRAIVRWDQEDRPTTFISPTELQAFIAPSDLLIRGVIPVTVSNPSDEGGVSVARGFSVRLVPSINSFTPGMATAGSPAITITVEGAGFAADSRFLWNGSPRAVTLISSTTLRVSIPASDLASPGRIPISIDNPAPGGTSSPRPFIINSPGAVVPVLAGLNPSSVRLNSPAVVVAVHGTNFVSGAVVEWEGAARSTVFVSTSELTATFPATDLVTAGRFNITVTNPAPNGGTSASVLFTVDGSTSTPRITAVTPNGAGVGGPAFTVTIDGENFAPAAVVRWNRSNRPTTFISPTRVQAAISAADIAAPGFAQLIVANPVPQSTPWIFPIRGSTAPAPGITNLSPATGVAGGPAFTLTVRGRDFTSGSVIQWNGVPHTTVFVSSVSLQTTITAADRATAGSIPVNVTDNGKTSNTLNFIITVSPTAPVIFTLSPSSTTASGSGFPLTVRGRLFTATSVVQWNGTPRVTTFISTTTLRAVILAADIASPGTASVTVLKSSETSNAVDFTIGQSTFSPPAGLPTVSSVSPSTVTAGGLAFTLVVLGSGFDPTSSVRWDSNFLTTTLISPTELRAQVTATLIAAPGTAVVTVFTPGPGGGTSQGQNIAIVEAKAAAVTDLGVARVFPNPWAADLHPGSPITFDRLTPNSTVKIFTISARWVRTLEAPGGTATWDLRTDGGDMAASGYYIYLITDTQGHRARGKLAIVR